MNKNKWFLNGGRGSGRTFRLLCETYENKIAELEERLKEHESVGNAQFWENVWSWKTKADQLTKAKELLSKWVELYKPKLEGYPITPIQKQTEQFLKGESTTEPSNECHDCAKFDEMPNGPRCKTCDNGSHFQKKEQLK